MKKVILFMSLFIVTCMFSQAKSDCTLQVENEMFVFEAERFELKGAWKIGLDEKASGGKYIYYSGPNAYGAPNAANNISYTFNIDTPGSYTFKWMMRQPEGERGSDLGNDAWFYFSDDIAKGSDIDGGEALTQYYKFVGRSDDEFRLNGNAEVNHKQTWVNVVFPEAGEYTLNLSGRSHEFQLDRIILYQNNTIEKLEVELSAFAETTTCEDQTEEESVIVVNAENTYPNKQLKIPFKLHYIASEQRQLNIAVRNENKEVIQTQKQTVERGAGILSIEFILDNELNVANNYEFYVTVKSIDETETFANGSAVFNIIEGEAPPEKDELAFVNPPLKLSSASTSIKIRAAYSATKPRDIILTLNGPGGGYIKNSKTVVPLGTGETDVNLDLGRTLWNANGFTLVMMLRPTGGNYDANLVRITTKFDGVPPESLSVEEIKALGVVMLKNPFNGVFNFTNDGKVKGVKLYNFNGQELLKSKAIKGFNSIATDNLTSGVYLAEFEFANNTRKVIKVIKQ